MGAPQRQGLNVQDPHTSRVSGSWKPEHTFLLARLTCLALGLCLLLWGFAPAIIEWLVSRRPVGLASIAPGGVALTLGLVLIVLHVFLSRRHLAAAWLALALSSGLVTLNLAYAIMYDIRSISASLLVLGGACAVASGRAIVAIRRERRARASRLFTHAPAAQRG